MWLWPRPHCSVMVTRDFNRWQSIFMSFCFILSNTPRLAPFPYLDTRVQWSAKVQCMPAIIAQADLDNSRNLQYVIWPRDGACHANHACAALTVSRSCRLAFVFFHWKCTQVSQAYFKRYHHDLLRHLVAFSKFEWFISSDHKLKNFSTHFVHKP